MDSKCNRGGTQPILLFENLMLAMEPHACLKCSLQEVPGMS